MTSQPRLVLLPSLQLQRGPNQGYVLTKKFVEGVRSYVARWPGPVTVAIEWAKDEDDNLDHAEYRPEELPFEVLPVSFDDREAMMKVLASARLVAAGLDHRQAHLAAWAKRAGTKIVYTTEYTLLTRWLILQAETSNPVLRLRRQAWTTKQEARFVPALVRADGVQCNGFPTYRLYKHLNRDTLLFFDTRTSEEMVVTPEELEAKMASVQEDRPLRLAFSGRLNRMKGADRLVDVAHGLSKRGVPFTFDVWGGGQVEPEMRERIAAHGLGAQMKLHGVVDFATELVPLVKRDIDLYVICHRQGDPSCTYLETLACGVPIVGFANEAWRGLSDEGAFGWSAPLDDVDGIVEHIARLHAQRRVVADAMRAAREFAAQHTFDRTFEARLDHLRRIAAV